MSVHAWLYAGSAYFSFNIFIIIFFIQQFSLPEVTRITSIAFITIYLLTFTVDYVLLQIKPKQSPIPYLAALWFLCAIVLYFITNETLISFAFIGAAVFVLLFQTKNATVNTFLTTFPPIVFITLCGVQLFFL